MNRIYLKFVTVLSITMIVSGSCKKYLDKNRSSSQGTLSTSEAIQALLDNPEMVSGYYSALPEIGADNIYLTSANWNSTNLHERNLYAWQRQESPDTWYKPYQGILNCNIALEELEKIKHKIVQPGMYKNLKGIAMFYRGFYFHALAQLFAPPYDKSTAAADPGLPLRLNSEFTTTSVRSSVAATYNQILADLKEAALLLPTAPLVKTRPCQPAAFAMIARTYLAMQQYDSAGAYADKCLQLYDTLMDFNALDVNAGSPIARFNKETIFWATSITYSAVLNPSRAKIDSVLYGAYATDDLRKAVFFRANTGANAGTWSFKGGYDGASTSNGYVFAGIATDEVLLTRAECLARASNTIAAMDDLNTLLQKRWKAGSFIPYTATDAQDALLKILAERRKELLFRGTRWTDMRRLMKEPAFAVTYKRIIDGQLYELIPNSPRYTILIPLTVIQMTGMPQNP